MPRTRSLAWSELKTGVITIVALGILATLIFMLTGRKGLPWERYSLKTRFQNVAGLRPGSPVRVAGVEVGTVKDTTLAGAQVEIVFQVNKEFQPVITTDSRATLGSVSMLGESAVDISPSTQGAPIPPWGYVPSGPPASQLADLTTQAGKGIEELNGLIHDIRRGQGTVGKLLTDDELYNGLERFVSSAGDLTEGLQRGRGTLGRLLNDPTMARTLETTLANVEEITRQINAGQGSLGQLLRNDAFATSLASTTSNLEALTAKLNRGEGTAGKLLNDPALYDRLNGVTQSLERILARLNEGEGTAGLLLKDRQLYENMNKVTADISALIMDIRKDPKKFLTVRVSIF